MSWLSGDDNEEFTALSPLIAGGSKKRIKFQPTNQRPSNFLHSHVRERLFPLPDEGQSQGRWRGHGAGTAWFC